MRRILLTALLLVATLAICTPAQARWGRHCGWGGGGWGGGGYCGYRSYGWGGYRSCGWGGYGVGYRGYGWGGCYAPVYSYGGCYPYAGFYSGYGGGYYSQPYGIGYYGYSPYNTYYNPQSNFIAYSLPSTVQPAELAYGPQAVKQFLGLNRNFALTNLNSPALKVLTIAARPAPAPADLKAAIRISNPEQRRKADQYIALGDSLFREQKFHSALQKYKLAAQAAPDMAEAYWREGHAMIATSNFELASGAFKRAIALDPDTGRGGFTLDKLYGPAGMAKTAHVEALASWASRMPIRPTRTF